MNFSKRLRYLRVLNGLTQEKLAKDIGEVFGYPITKATISQYENERREPGLDVLMFFSQYFNCSIDYLLGVSEHSSIVDASEFMMKIKILKLFVYILEKIDLTQLHKLYKIMLDFKRDNELN